MFKMKSYFGMKKCFKVIGLGKVIVCKVGKCYFNEYKFLCVICCLIGEIVLFKGEVVKVKKLFVGYFGC